MKRQVLKGDIGKRGWIIAGQKGYEKTVYGTVMYVDYFGAVSFLDNDDILHLFRLNQVASFDEEEFKDTNKQK